MSRYATLARTWWAEHRPSELAQMEDPAGFFSTLDEQIEARIAALAPELEGSSTSGEGYLEAVGRLNAARSQAQEIALDELVFSIGPETPLIEEPDEMAAELLALHREIREAIA